VTPPTAAQSSSSLGALTASEQGDLVHSIGWPLTDAVQSRGSIVLKFAPPPNPNAEKPNGCIADRDE
jgi:hypothetical protein